MAQITTSSINAGIIPNAAVANGNASIPPPMAVPATIEIEPKVFKFTANVLLNYYFICVGH
jgi:hypothetical protein